MYVDFYGDVFELQVSTKKSNAAEVDVCQCLQKGFPMTRQNLYLDKFTVVLYGVTSGMIYIE